MAQLLVSVRGVEEAEAALAGGAHVIDVKEPSRGSLGRADDAVVEAVIRSVAGRRPVSAACGELLESCAPPVSAGLSYLKWGLAGCASLRDWRDRLHRSSLARPSCNQMPLSPCGRGVRGEGSDSSACSPLTPAPLPRGERGEESSQCATILNGRSTTSSPACSVAVIYADYQRAGAPVPEEVIDFASANSWQVLLVDTWCKDGSTLLDWISMKDLAALRRQCHATKIRLAIAGSLGMTEIEQLRQVEPDWFAVRGAACQNGKRTLGICEEQVRRLVQVL